MMCNVPECNKPNKARGLCSKHYSQWFRYCRLTPELERNPKPLTCIVENCNNPVKCKNYCAAHYEHYRVTGKVKKELSCKNKNKQCSSDNCGREAVSKGLCNKHWNQVATHGQLTPEKERLYCKQEGCYVNAYYHELCIKHFCKIMNFTEQEAYKYKLKESRTLKFYNISLEEKKAIWIHQGHKCLICGQLVGLDKIHIDHDHNAKTENNKPIVRGLLCGNCNLGLGNFQDNIDILRSAIKYLEGKNYTMSITYSVGEIIDRISICELKLYHLQRLVNSITQTEDSKKRITKQIESQETYKCKLISALTVYMDEQQVENFLNITNANLSIWGLESEMADKKTSNKDKINIQNQIIKQNTFRVKNVESITSSFEIKNKLKNELL